MSGQASALKLKLLLFMVMTQHKAAGDGTAGQAMDEPEFAIYIQIEQLIVRKQ